MANVLTTGTLPEHSRQAELATLPVTYPFDTSPVTPTLIYSSRKMLTSYAGNCVQIENADSGATQNIGFAADGWMDVSAVRSFLGRSRGYVRVLYDQSGNGDDASFASGEVLLTDERGVIYKTPHGRPYLCRRSIDTVSQVDITLTEAFDLSGHSAWYAGACHGPAGGDDCFILWTDGDNKMQLLCGEDGIVLDTQNANDRVRLTSSVHPRSSYHLMGIYSSTTNTSAACTFSNATNTVNSTAHGLSNGDIIKFNGSSGSVPSELATNKGYIVSGVATDSFQLTKRSGGQVVQFGDPGGSATWTKFVVSTLTNGFLDGAFDLDTSYATPSTGDAIRFNAHSNGSIFDVQSIVVFANTTSSSDFLTINDLYSTGVGIRAFTQPTYVHTDDSSFTTPQEDVLFETMSEWDDIEAFDVTPTTFPAADISLYTEEEAYYYYFMFGNGAYGMQPVMAQSKWYVVDDGAGAGLLGSDGARAGFTRSDNHDYIMGTDVGIMYKFDLRTQSGQGNWAYQNDALGRRALQVATLYTLQKTEQMSTNGYWRNMEWRGKNGLTLALAAFYLGHLWSPTQRKLIAEWVKWYLEQARTRPYRTGLGNMEIEGLGTWGMFWAAFPEDARLRELCVETSKNIMFGTGRDVYDPDNLVYGGWKNTGYYHEGNSIEMGYTGRALTSITDGRVATLGAPEWEFLDEVLRSMCLLRGTIRTPAGIGDYTQGTGWNSRTGNIDEDNDHKRQLSLTLLYEEGRFLRPYSSYSPIDQNNFDSLVSDLNSKTGEKNDNTVYDGNGWAGPLHTNTPKGPNSSAPWPAVPDYSSITMDYLGRPQWLTDYAAHDAQLQLAPHFRDAPHNYALGNPAEVWSYKGFDAATDQEWGFIVEGIRNDLHYCRFSSFQGGGRIEGFWAEDIGTAIGSYHGKGGGDDDEDTRKNLLWKHLPNMGFSFDRTFTIDEIVVTAGTDVKARMLPNEGDWSSSFPNSASYMSQVGTSSENTQEHPYMIRKGNPGIFGAEYYATTNTMQFTYAKAVQVVNASSVEIDGDWTNADDSNLLNFDDDDQFGILETDGVTYRTALRVNGSITYDGGTGRTTIPVDDVKTTVVGDFCLPRLTNVDNVPIVGRSWGDQVHSGMAYGSNNSSASSFNYSGTEVTSVDFTVDTLDGVASQGGYAFRWNSDISIASSLTLLSDGIEYTGTLSAGATAQNYNHNYFEYAIPVVLRNPDHDAENATISYLDSNNNWRVLATGVRPTTSRLRINRSGGNRNGTVYIYLDQARVVDLGFVWTQVANQNNITQNILVEMASANTAFAASTSFTWSVRTTDPGPFSDALSMSVSYPSTTNPTVPVGGSVFVQFARFGGTSPTFTVEASTDGGVTFPTVLTGTVKTDDNLIYEFVGDGHATTGVYQDAWTHLRVRGVDPPDDDAYSAAIYINTRVPTLWLHDDFTDTDGTTWAAHVESPLAPTVAKDPNITVTEPDPDLLIDSNTLAILTSSGTRTGNYDPNDNNGELWYTEALLKRNLFDPGSANQAGNNRGIYPSFDLRKGLTNRKTHPYIVTLPNATPGIRWQTNNTGGQSGAAGEGDYPFLDDTWYLFKLWKNTDHTVCAVYDATGTTQLDIAVLYATSAGGNADGIGFAFRGTNEGGYGRMDYLKIYRYDQ